MCAWQNLGKLEENHLVPNLIVYAFVCSIVCFVLFDNTWQKRLAHAHTCTHTRAQNHFFVVLFCTNCTVKRKTCNRIDLLICLIDWIHKAKLYQIKYLRMILCVLRGASTVATEHDAVRSFVEKYILKEKKKEKRDTQDQLLCPLGVYQSKVFQFGSLSELIQHK